MKKVIYILFLVLGMLHARAGHNFNMVTHTFQPHPTIPNTYLITLEAVIPCNGGVAPDSITVSCEWVGAITFSTSKKLNKVADNILPTSPTIGITTSCQVANSNIPGFRVVSYNDTVAALGALASVTYRNCNRADFTNMDTTCVANHITKNVANNLESNIGSTRVLYMYANSNMQYDMNVTDLENDSTSIKLVPPADSMQTWGTSLLYQNANYKPGYTLAQPLGAGSSATITDTFLNITSQNPGVYLLTVQIEDYDTTLNLPISLSKSLNDFIIVVMPNNPTIVDNRDDFEMYLSPNPISDNLRIAGIRENDEIVVFNQLGQPVYKKMVKSVTEGNISLNELSNGVYFLKVTRQDKICMRRILKN